MTIITLDELKEFYGISTDTSDSLLEAARLAGEGDVRRLTGRSFEQVQTATARVFAPLDACLLLVDDFWTTTDLAVKTDGDGDGTFETTWSASDYELHPLNGRYQGEAWPYFRIEPVRTRWFPTQTGRNGSVEITAKWGWETVPGAVKQAACILAASRERVRDLVRGEGGFTRWSREDASEMLAPFVHPRHIGIA